MLSPASLVLLALASAAAPERTRVLVLPVTAERVERDLARPLDDLIARELAREAELEVVTVRDLDAVLAADRLRELLRCDEIGCAVELGGAVRADALVAARLASIGGELDLALEWIDPDAILVTARAGVAARDERALVAAVPRAVQALRGRAPERKPLQPTFFTAEISAGPSVLGGVDAAPGAAGNVRLSWGGRRRGALSSFHLVLGVGGALHPGTRIDRDGGGQVTVSQESIQVYLEGRIARPLDRARKLRVFAGLGGGAAFEHMRGETEEGLGLGSERAGPELRLSGGAWYRLSMKGSLFAAYRGRLVPYPSGVDPVHELVALSSTPSAVMNHEMELGWAFHF